MAVCALASRLTQMPRVAAEEIPAQKLKTLFADLKAKLLYLSCGEFVETHLSKVFCFCFRPGLASEDLNEK